MYNEKYRLMICHEAYVPHDFIGAELATSEFIPMLNLINQIQTMPCQTITHMRLEPLKKMITNPRDELHVRNLDVSKEIIMKHKEGLQ